MALAPASLAGRSAALRPLTSSWPALRGRAQDARPPERPWPAPPRPGTRSRGRLLARACAGAAAGFLAAGPNRGGWRPAGVGVASARASTGAAWCATASATAGTAIEKPDTHRRRVYEHFQLSGNGLRVIVASDPTCDKAAAALCVGVGRLHEPKDMPGLAHFCEHMLFLGTEAFPDEAEYKRFIKRHGGKCNAATGDAYTCYAFDVAPDFLSGALDRFSQFFVSPLFTSSATERELNAVDSEHSMRITDDGRRSYATLLMDANPRHPLHWGSGNAHSLRDAPRRRGADPHKEVVAFWREHYSSEDMTLAVFGRDSLADLRSMVVSRFEGVRATGSRALRGDAHGGDESAILPSDFPGLVLRVPSKDARLLDFDWQLPRWQVPLWPSKPGAYAAFLLGHEGEGSLLSALKARGLVTSLSAGVSNFGCFSHFNVGVTLTEAGLDSVEEVGRLIFTYLRLVRATPVLPWVLDEMQKLRDIRFRFADDYQPYDLVSTLARNQQLYPPSMVLAAPVKLFVPDATAAQDTLSDLSVDRLRVELVAKRFTPRCTATDPWYSGQYARLPLEAKWRATWTAAAGDAGPARGAGATAERQVAEEQATASGMRLPRPNPFVPENLSLREGTAGQAPNLPHEVPLQGVDLAFHRQDDQFRQPKTVLALRFHSPSAATDAASYLRCQVWCSAVVEELNEYAYDARMAGLSYRLHAVPGGVELRASGFSDKLPLLVRTVARRMREASTVSPGTFAIVKDRYERSLKNRALKQRPCDLAERKTRELRHSLSFPVEDQLEALEGLVPESLDGENGRLLGTCRMEALVTGNADAEDAAAVVAAATEELPPPAAPAELPGRAEAELPPGSTLWVVEGPNPEERNGNVRVEIQLPLGLENSVHTSLVVRVLNPRFFEELRTKQQLGYIVQMSASEGEGFLTIACTVQSEYPPDFVRARVDDFLDEHLSWLERGLDAEEFARQRQGLAANLAEAPKSLGEEFDRFWAEIARQRYDFGRRARKRRAADEAALEAFRAFARGPLRAAPRLYVEVRSTCAGAGKAPPAGAAPPRMADREWRRPAELRAFRAGARWAAEPEGRGAGAAGDAGAPPARL